MRLLDPVVVRHPRITAVTSITPSARDGAALERATAVDDESMGTLRSVAVILPRTRSRTTVVPVVRSLWEALLPFLATRLPLVVAGTLSVALLPLSRYVPSYWIITGVDRVFDAFSRWDAWHYTRLAGSGYPSSDPSRAAFFPLFPTLLRLVAELQGRTDRPGLFVAAVVVANICLVAATIALAALVRLELGPDDARRSAWYLLAFPTTLFLTAGYSESLFLLLTVGAVLACRTDRWLLAAGLGLLAAVTRPVGLVLALPLAVEALVVWRASGRPSWRPAVAVLAPCIGLGGWMLFLAADYHDPLAFLHAQQGWDRSLELPWDTFVHFFEGHLTLQAGLHSLTDLAFTLAGIALAILAWRWLRPSYALYLTALLLVPLSTGTLLSMPRFLLVMFPVYLVLAILGRRFAFHETVLVVGMGLASLFMVMYAQWYWVA